MLKANDPLQLRIVHGKAVKKCFRLCRFVGPALPMILLIVLSIASQVRSNNLITSQTSTTISATTSSGYYVILF